MRIGLGSPVGVWGFKLKTVGIGLLDLGCKLCALGCRFEGLGLGLDFSASDEDLLGVGHGVFHILGSIYYLLLGGRVAIRKGDYNSQLYNPIPNRETNHYIPSSCPCRHRAPKKSLPIRTSPNEPIKPTWR